MKKRFIAILNDANEISAFYVCCSDVCF